MKRLREISCGKWEGLNGVEVEELFPGQIELWGNSPAECYIEAEIHFRKYQTVL